MNREFHAIPFVRIVFFWVAGILLGNYLTSAIPVFVPIFIFLFFLGVLKLRSQFLIQLFAALTVISLGVLRMESFDLSRFEEVKDAEIVVRLTEPVLPKKNSLQLKGEIISQDTSAAIPALGASVLLFASKDGQLKLDYGDHIYVKADLQAPRPPTNPGQFDYAAYLKRQGIAYTAYISSSDLISQSTNSASFFWKGILRFREGAISLIENQVQDADHQQILKALLVGDRSELSTEVRERFSSTGTIHIMAVSGLHVGIIYGVFFLFLRGQQRAEVRWIVSALALLTIWTFAAITGFSPPVQRACIMFSVLLVALVFRRQSNIYNSLAFSALIVLLINPTELFQAGFQLSYAAVLGIVFFQPKLYELVNSKWWIMDKIWLLLTVSLSAQLLTAPLLLYYFHQFPTYFLLSNLLVVPLVPVILYLGFTLIFIGSLGVVIPFTWKVLAFIVEILDTVVKLVASFPGGIIEVPGFDLPMVIIVVLLVLTMMLIINTRSVHWLKWSAFLVVGMSIYSIGALYNTSQQHLMVFYDSKTPSFEHVRGFSSNLIFDPADTQTRKYILEPASQYFRLVNRLESYTEFNSEFSMGDLTICLLSQDNYSISDKVDILYLSRDEFELESELFSNFSYDTVILGRDCSFKFRENVKLHLKDKAEVHDLRSDGALVINL